MAKVGRKGRAVIGFLKTTGETVEYDNVIVASKSVGVCRQAIVNAIEGGFKSGGFNWKYRD